MSKYKGEPCDKCKSVNTILITTSPRDSKARYIPKKHRWQCRDCEAYFLVDASKL